MDLNNTLNQVAVTDIFTIFHPKTAEWAFFSGAHGTFSRIDDIRSHTHTHTHLRKFKKIKVIPRIFSENNTMELEINHKKKSGKPQIHGG